jgi:hypothetical protein
MTTSSRSTPVVDGRFLLLERVGTGGMGSVYRAFDRLDERAVALKVLRPEVPANPPEALAEEFRAWAALRHPFIVRAHEFRVSREGPVPPGTPYLVLEYVRGVPAHRALRPGETGPGTLEEFARRVLAALDHVHGAGLVHRDLKPGNILVGRSSRGLGRVKLTDFGLAAPSGVRREFGRFSGSLPFMAPESVLGGPLDGRTDLYALGVLLHLLASGKLPFDARDPEAVVRWHLSHAGADPRKFGAVVPERLARFVVRLTRSSPADRPRDARQALEALGAPRVRARSLPVPLRGARAVLRMALDAARTGSPRVVPLPSVPAVCREITVAAQLDGFVVQRLRPGSRPATSNLDRLMFRAILEHPDAARVWARETRGKRGLPLGLLGGLPVWDRLPPGATEPRGAPARAAAAVWMRLARGPGLVLVVEAGAARDPVARAAVEALREEAARAGSRARLLLVASEEVVRRQAEPRIAAAGS